MLLSALILLLVAGLANVYFSIQILRKVAAAEIRISFFELRYQVHKHLKAYKQLCRQQDGRLGTEYFGYWISLAVMIGAALLLFFQLPWETL